MLIKIITLSFSSAHGGFNDAELRDFIKAFHHHGEISQKRALYLI